MSRVDKTAGILLFLFFGGAFLYARGFPPLAATYVFIINILGMGLSGILILVAFINDLRKKTGSVKKNSKEAWIRIGVTSAASILYVILLKIIGYIPSTIIYGAGMILYLYLGRKNKRYCLITLGVSVSITLILYFVFGKMLYIPLP